MGVGAVNDGRVVGREEGCARLAGRPMTPGAATAVDERLRPPRPDERHAVPVASPRRSPSTRDGRAALIPYVVAGYPDADTSFEIALAAADAGADVLEVGLPYSDPLADGATLQRASGVALVAGATLERSLRLIERIGAARPDLPLVPMGYANQVIGGGDGGPVAKRLAGAGAAGLIVADLTPDEGALFETVARAAGLAVVYLVAPTTPPDRRAAVAARSGGFLYCVSLVGVTGARTNLPSSVGRLVRDVKAVSPVPVGGRFRRQPPGPCPGDREGRWGRRRRCLGSRRRAGARWPRHRRGRRARRSAPCRDRAHGARLSRGRCHARRAGSRSRSRRRRRRRSRRSSTGRAGPAPARPRKQRSTRSPRPRRDTQSSFMRRAMRFPAAAADRDAYEVVERTGAGSGTEFGVPSSITDLDRRPVDAADARREVRLLEAAWTVFDRVAASAPAELRKGPRGGGRDRDKMIAPRHRVRVVLRARDRSPREARRTPRRPVRRRGAPRGDARRPAQTIGRLAARRAKVASALRRPADRVACAGSCLGDGRPGRASVEVTWLSGTGPPRRPPRSNRGVSISPTAAAASPMSSAGVRPPARRSRIEVSPSAFDSFAPSARRTSR